MLHVHTVTMKCEAVSLRDYSLHGCGNCERNGGGGRGSLYGQMNGSVYSSAFMGGLIITKCNFLVRIYLCHFRSTSLKDENVLLHAGVCLRVPFDRVTVKKTVGKPLEPHEMVDFAGVSRILDSIYRPRDQD